MKFDAIAVLCLLCFSDAVKPSAKLQRAAAFLSTEAHQLGSAELTALAHEAQNAENNASAPDGLEGVKHMLRNMLARKMDQHAELATHASFCKKETSASKEKVGYLKRRIEKSNADKDMLEATLAELKEKIADTTAGIATSHKAIAKATAMQSKLASKDGEFIAPGASFESRVEEKQNSAVKEIELQGQLQQLQAGNAKDQKAVEHMQGDIVRKNRDLCELKGDLKGYADQLKASQQYADQIGHQCNVPPASSGERQSRRLEEVDRLKEAQSILSGDDIYTGAF